MKPPSNPTAPHAVVIYFKAEVREKLPTGELSGNMAHAHPEKGTKHWEVFKMEAQDKSIAIRKLNELLRQLRSEGFTSD